MENSKLARRIKKCIITPMYLELTKENMLLFFPSWEKPLSDKEITDFLETPYQEEPRLWWPEWIKDLPRKVGINPVIKHYKTKSAIKQAIREINDQLELWLAHKQAAPNEISKEFAEAHLEDLFREKEKLQARLRYTGVKFDNKNLERAKMMPISDYLLFNKAGFAKCLWHSEHSPSLHRIKSSNRVYCFGCGKTADVVDVVMEVNNCTLPEAIKIILR